MSKRNSKTNKDTADQPLHQESTQESKSDPYRDEDGFIVLKPKPGRTRFNDYFASKKTAARKNKLLLDFLDDEEKKWKSHKHRNKKESPAKLGATTHPLKLKKIAKKRLDGLFDNITTEETVKRAIDSASIGKRDREDVYQIRRDPDKYIENLIKELVEGTWYPPEHTTVRINEGNDKKPRDITKPNWPREQVVHHLIINELKDRFIHMMDKNIMGSVPGRGPLKATEHMAKWVSKYNGKKFYVAELDIRKFYDNIDHRILKKMLKCQIRDKEFLDIVYRIIDSYQSTEGLNIGLPLGNYTSPWFANFYLVPLDNLILHDLEGIDHYLRYLDNLYLYSRNKKQLHYNVIFLEAWLIKNLGLWLKNTKQVYRFEYIDGEATKKKCETDPISKPVYKGRPINSLGYVIHCDRVTVRKTTIAKTFQSMKGSNLGETMDYEKALAAASRIGMLFSADAHKYYDHNIAKNVKFSVVKEIVSSGDKAINRVAAPLYTLIQSAVMANRTLEQGIKDKILIRTIDENGEESYSVDPDIVRKYYKEVVVSYDKLDKGKRGRKAPRDGYSNKPAGNYRKPKHQGDPGEGRNVRQDDHGVRV